MQQFNYQSGIEAMSASHGHAERPACQAANPGQCSNCTMSYDCARVRSGRSVSWALAAVVIILALAILSRGLAGA